MNIRIQSVLFPVLLIMACALLASSCAEDVVTVDLNRAKPQIVIEGAVTEGSGPHTVRISMTTDYFKPSDYPSVSGATVVISDDAGNTETLVEKEPGVYTTVSTVGGIGKTYTLDVEDKGIKYHASSTMFAVGHIDSLAFEIDSEDDESYIVHCYFQDTLDVQEYYRLKMYINNEQIDDYYMYQDRLTDGNYLDAELWVDEKTIEHGDIIVIETQTIDRPVYQYFNTLTSAATEMSSGLTMFTGTPANPTSNISNGALGYFSAYSAVYDTLIVDKLHAIK